MQMTRGKRFLVNQFVRRTTKYLKRTSSGNDLVIYCGQTPYQWDPDPSNVLGGSEEAVINLTRELVKLDWNVTVYGSCGHKPLVDVGVTYCPFWEFNPWDKQDVLVIWRWPRCLDFDINADKIFVDMHDALDEKVFTDHNRIGRVTGIFMKNRYQRSLYPNLPDSKIAVIPNGIDLSLLDGDEEKDPYLLINTSSVDRSMSVLPKLFKRVKESVPQARLQWAYGWNRFQLSHQNNPEGLQWMEKIRREMQDAGIETLGHLTLAEVGKLYQRGALLAYPTDFVEIDPISVRKAQACGCVPVTTDVGGLADSVQFGVKVPCEEPNPPVQPGRFYYGAEDPETQRMWVDATVDLLNNSAKRFELAAEGRQWARQFTWPRIAARWDDVLRG